ncbi:hypothetical protein [Fictibacillus terranigra]|uniref:Gas vesicle protein n=1 Tax=Fictibacillus terranigra TaxID=3058424 RepID=A0ABT8EBF4_9BACL|nr:hypothetical protein [Fictibacillus sp. CENA-BCM004]MDN4075215.1 hypothetical protein [Fictibacillus sp. CENA-BCM004]
MAYKTFDTYERNDSKLVKGLLIGAAVGAAIAMLDRPTRQTVKRKTLDVKDQTVTIAKNVKENPQSLAGGVKETFQSASSAVSDVMDDIKQLMSTMEEVKNTSIEAMQQVRGASSDLVKIGSKLKDAGQDVKEHGKDVVGEVSDTDANTAPSYSDLQNKRHVVTPNEGSY